jgi:hypothetical protein
MKTIRAERTIEITKLRISLLLKPSMKLKMQKNQPTIAMNGKSSVNTTKVIFELTLFANLKAKIDTASENTENISPIISEAI